MKLAALLTLLVTTAPALGCLSGDDLGPVATPRTVPAGDFRLLLHLGPEQRSCASADVDLVELVVDGELLGGGACGEEPLDVALPAGAALIEVVAYRARAGGATWHGQAALSPGQQAALVELTP